MRRIQMKKLKISKLSPLGVLTLAALIGITGIGVAQTYLNLNLDWTIHDLYEGSKTLSIDVVHPSNGTIAYSGSPIGTINVYDGSFDACFSLADNANLTEYFDYLNVTIRLTQGTSDLLKVVTFNGSTITPAIFENTDLTEEAYECRIWEIYYETRQSGFTTVNMQVWAEE